jgi:N-acetylglucosaminyldiphosphoundecaprenol N-acetyl-beta-D-mannosaminyltransferase
MATPAVGVGKREVGLAIERIRMASCPVDRISFADTIAELCHRIDTGSRTHVVFINAAKLVKYHHHPELQQAIERADLLLADGMPIVWASHLFGKALPGRVNGTDLMEALVAEAERRQYGVFFFGGTEDVLQAAIREFRRRHPSLIVAGARNGYFNDDEVPAIIDEVNQSGAQILLVAISTPQKELWVDRNLGSLEVAVAQGVGGSFDVIAGLVPRAPLWMQRSGLEWFFRFLQEPGRMWKRYLETNSLFIWLVLKDFFRSRRLRTQSGD